jgi:proline iminopeptidase
MLTSDMDEIDILPPFNSLMLDGGNGHIIYVEESGNPNGLPIVNFHGGPGSHSKPKHRARYDLKKFRLILFDQRNGGQSTPLAINDKTSLQYNSPAAIVKDANAIRQHLGLEKWHVSGASWGSAMALLYALTYPQHTSTLTLRALFLAQVDDWAWMAEGARLFCPPANDKAQSLCPDHIGIDLMKALAEKILTAPRAEALEATKALMAMEGGLELLAERNPEPKEPKPDAELLNVGLLYAHMIKHHMFETGWAVTPAAQNALHGIPTTITHGNCDASCLIKNVYDMRKAHPHIDIHIALNSGHGVDLDGDNERLFQSVLAAIG